MTSRKTSTKNNQATEYRILEKAVSLFATHGLTGVSMRDLSREIGITPGALYHYFPDKQSLHLAAVQHAYLRSGPYAIEKLKDNTANTPEEKLRSFIHRLCERFYEDPEFQMLVQRCLMDPGSESRDMLIEQVFKKNFNALKDLLETLAPAFDPHLLATSIFGLVMHFYTTREIRHELPGYKAKHDLPANATDHIMKLLKGGILQDT